MGEVRVKIHRGSHQIGGSITELYTDNTHIFIDFGSELNADPEDSTDEEMVKRIQHAKCDAVLFTHYHGDHIGLMDKIPAGDIDGKPIKLGLGETARQVLVNIHKILAENSDASEAERQYHREYISILNDAERKLDLKDNTSFAIGDFEITPIMVDHSAYDAYMFVIKACGKVIVHTGDFRTHGRLGKDFFVRLSKLLDGLNIDVLITEGTMMSRLNEKVRSEPDMEKEALKLLSKPENKYAFLICSSTNMESLASFANAAMYLGRAFYVNYYVYEQIELYRQTAGQLNSKFKFKKTYKFEDIRRFNPRLGMTQPEYMREHGFVMLIGSSEAYNKRIEPFKDDNPLLIYSMWGGYIKKDKDTYDEALGNRYHNWTGHKADLHTSGHATADDIRNMILTVKPQKYIIPIHTEEPEGFKKLDIGECVAELLIPEDGIVVEV